VAGVKVSIKRADGKFIEEGPATQEADGNLRFHTTAQANPEITCSRIIAIASDLPGKADSLEIKV